MQTLIGGARALGFSLNKRQIEQFETYYRELVDWNNRVNLTAIVDYEEVQTKHFVDSLTATLAFKRTDGLTDLKLIDVGTGGGFPGIPLKLLLPGISLTLLEATRKRTVFLEHVKDVLKLEGVDVVVGRAEDIARRSDHRERYDVAVSRAVAALPTLLELTVPFCRIGGTFVAMKQTAAKEETRQAKNAARILGAVLKGAPDIDLPGLAGRCLIVYEKVEPTPEQYPRRAGTPSKYPLS
jgi:16S rRNA (guanine527-N7)-methyltransferase